MLRRGHTLTYQREQLKSTNLAAERQQSAKPLRVVAAHDRQNNMAQRRNAQVRHKHRNDRIREKISSREVATANKELERSAVQKSIPQSAHKRQKPTTEPSTRDNARAPTTRTAATATAPQSPNHTLAGHQRSQHSAIEQKGVPRESKTMTAQGTAAHQVLHVRILHLVHTRGGHRRNHASLQRIEKTTISTDSST